jgi:hypothetical protein
LWKDLYLPADVFSSLRTLQLAGPQSSLAQAICGSLHLGIRCANRPRSQSGSRSLHASPLVSQLRPFTASVFSPAQDTGKREPVAGARRHHPSRRFAVVLAHPGPVSANVLALASVRFSLHPPSSPGKVDRVLISSTVGGIGAVNPDLKQLKQHLPLLDYLLRSNWTARRVGVQSEFVGLCPLHAETHPSSMSMRARICSTATAAAAAAPRPFRINTRKG